MNLRILISISLLFTSEASLALPDKYECEVKQIVKLDDSGNLENVLENSPTASLYKSLIGTTFSVDRATGNIYGSEWYETSNFEEVTVISDGRMENNFRASYIGGAPTSVTTFLYINEQAPVAEKPFLIFDSSFVELTSSGICK